MSWLAAQAPRAAGPPLAPGAKPGASVSTTAAADAARLSMYDAPPRGDVAVEEFERAALDRLKGERIETEEGDGGGAVRGRCARVRVRRRCAGGGREGGEAGAGGGAGDARAHTLQHDANQKTANNQNPLPSSLSPSVLKGIEDAKAKGVKGSQLDVSFWEGRGGGGREL